METKLLNQTQNLIDKDQKNKFDTVEYANEQSWTFFIYIEIILSIYSIYGFLGLVVRCTNQGTLLPNLHQ